MTNPMTPTAHTPLLFPAEPPCPAPGFDDNTLGALALGVGTSVLLAKRCGMKREQLVGFLRWGWNDLSRKKRRPHA